MSDTLRQSMTYGTLPTFEAFEAAFEAECPRGTYEITLGSSDSRAVDGFKLGDGEWTARGLFDACQEILSAENEPVSHADTCDVTSADLEYAQSCPVCGQDVVYTVDGAINLVASIMDTLGFEWI